MVYDRLTSRLECTVWFEGLAGIVVVIDYLRWRLRQICDWWSASGHITIGSTIVCCGTDDVPGCCSWLGRLIIQMRRLLLLIWIHHLCSGHVLSSILRHRGCHWRLSEVRTISVSVWRDRLWGRRKFTSFIEVATIVKMTYFGMSNIRTKFSRGIWARISGWRTWHLFELVIGSQSLGQAMACLARYLHLLIDRCWTHLRHLQLHHDFL